MADKVELIPAVKSGEGRAPDIPLGKGAQAEAPSGLRSVGRLPVILGYGAVELRRGLAFIRQRVEKLAEPRAAPGISRDGLDPEVRLQEKVFVVVLFLKPAQDFGFDIPLWAMKKFRAENTIRKLRATLNPGAVARILREA